MLMQGFVPSPTVLLRAPPSLVAGWLVLPLLWEVFAAGPACLSVALPSGLNSCRSRDSPGLSSQSVLQSGCPVPCVWPEGGCVQAACVPCNAESPQERPQGGWI